MKKLRLSAMIILSFALLLTACAKEDSYRIVKLKTYEGDVIYTRDDKTDEVYINMNFENGDTVETGKKSSATISLDSDKTLYMQEMTEILMEAEGDAKDSRTVIHLESGEIINEITEPLTSGALYEIKTSNASIGVQGTTFLVRYEEERTIVYCEIGKVKVVADDGERKTVGAGEGVIVEDDKILEIPSEEIPVWQDILKSTLAGKPNSVTPPTNENTSETASSEAISATENQTVANQYTAQEIVDMLLDYANEGAPLNYEMLAEIKYINTGFLGTSSDGARYDTDASDDYSFLQYCTNLTSLSLPNGTPFDLAYVAELPNLTGLHMEGSSITNFTLIENMTQLEALSLQKVDVTDWSSLANLTQLTSLNLNNNTITNTSFFENMNQLEELYLTRTGITTIDFLANTPNMKYLSIAENPIDDITLLAQLPDLLSLSFSRTNVTDLTPIAGLKNLNALDVSKIPLTEANLEIIHSFTNLTSLTLSIDVPEETLQTLKEWFPDATFTIS